MVHPVPAVSRRSVNEGGVHKVPSASGSSDRNEASESHVRDCWRRADAVCFDVDSTVCQDEGIDELARYLGVGEQVAAATRAAMNGNVSFRQALSERLRLIQPSRQDIEQYKMEHGPKLTPGIAELVGRLKARGTAVYLVSGGFKSLIEPVAERLNLPKSHIFANEILFDANGDYAGFDTKQPTSESGGKAAVCALLKQRHHYRCLVVVGEGATDMEACPPADAFIGFGGNQIRQSVQQGAKWFVRSFQELTTELDRANPDQD